MKVFRSFSGSGSRANISLTHLFQTLFLYKREEYNIISESVKEECKVKGKEDEVDTSGSKPEEDTCGHSHMVLFQNHTSLSLHYSDPIISPDSDPWLQRFVPIQPHKHR